MKATLLHAAAALLAACATPPSARTPDDRVPPPDGPRAAAAAPAPPPRLPDRPDLPALLRVALDRNPRIRAARERALAGSENARADGGLPDPRLLVGWYATPVQTRVGPQGWSLGIQQPIPWPGKLRARSELGAALARRDLVAYERTVRDVLVGVVRAAHEIGYLDTARDITEAQAALLDRYVAAAAAGETGSPVGELFRAQAQSAQLANDRILLDELRAAEAENLRALLDLPSDAPVGTPAPGAVPRIRASFDTLLAVARAHNHELRAAGVDVETAALRAELARRDRLPDVTLGYTRVLTDRLDGASPARNGDDPDIFTLGLTLPVWRGRNAASIRRAESLARAAAWERDDERLRLRSRLARAWYRVGQAQRLATLYADLLVPRAEAAARTAEDLQAGGKGTLAGTLETLGALHNFRLAAARARADHGQAVAELEALLGRPLEETR